MCTQWFVLKMVTRWGDGDRAGHESCVVVGDYVRGGGGGDNAA